MANELVKRFIKKDGSRRISFYREDYAENPRYMTDEPLHCEDWSRENRRTLATSFGICCSNMATARKLSRPSKTTTRTASMIDMKTDCLMTALARNGLYGLGNRLGKTIKEMCMRLTGKKNGRSAQTSMTLTYTTSQTFLRTNRLTPYVMRSIGSAFHFIYVYIPIIDKRRYIAIEMA